MGWGHKVEIGTRKRILMDRQKFHQLKESKTNSVFIFLLERKEQKAISIFRQIPNLTQMLITEDTKEKGKMSMNSMKIRIK